MDIDGRASGRLSGRAPAVQLTSLLRVRQEAGGALLERGHGLVRVELDEHGVGRGHGLGGHGRRVDVEAGRGARRRRVRVQRQEQAAGQRVAVADPQPLGAAGQALLLHPEPHHVVGVSLERNASHRISGGHDGEDSNKVYNH